MKKLFKAKKNFLDEDLIEVEELVEDEDEDKEDIDDEDEDEEETKKTKDSAIRLTDGEVALFRAMIQDLAPLAENSKQLLSLLDKCHDEDEDEEEEKVDDEDLDEKEKTEDEEPDEEEEIKDKKKGKDSLAYFNSRKAKTRDSQINDEEIRLQENEAWGNRFGK